ncbi:MAG: hypothetical protein JNG84_09025 [Archangium sp.]|nr:hypothetical protein [Archangium sp.]
MSVTSVRRAVSAALADKKVTLAEAEKMTAIAGRTSGISAAERKELAKALSSTKARFEAGAKEHLAANAVSGFDQSGAKALEQVINARGLDVLSGLKTVKEPYSAALTAAADRFAAGVDSDQSGSMLLWGSKEFTVGKEKIYVLSDMTDDGAGEVVGFFNKKGEELARVQVTQKDSGMSMRWTQLSGKAKTTPIGTASQHETTKVSAAFKKELEAFVDAQRNTDEGLGPNVANKTLPADVRRHAEFMERIIADGMASQRFEYKGATYYALWDESCVSTVHVYDGNGQRLVSLVD